MGRVLILHERSGVIREEFRKRGHDADSCDLVAAEDGSIHHFQCDAMEAVEGHHCFDCDNYIDLHRSGEGHPEEWDLIIAHPECTDLSVSGALRFKEKIADGRQQRSIEAFMKVAKIQVKRLCIENPISIMSTRWRKPDQIIQPYEFGHDASKKTCLWLQGLPRLVRDPAQYVQPRWVCKCGYRCETGFKWCPKCRLGGKALPRWANQTDSGQNRLGPSEKRAMDRARTYRGIAEAMAEQWGALI